MEKHTLDKLVHSNYCETSIALELGGLRRNTSVTGVAKITKPVIIKVHQLIHTHASRFQTSLDLQSRDRLEDRQKCMLTRTETGGIGKCFALF